MSALTSTTALFIYLILGLLLLMAWWDSWMDRRYNLKSQPRPLPNQNRRAGNSPRDWR